MTATLRFASEEALRVAMASFVPEATRNAPARAWRGADGAVLVRPKAALDTKSLAALKAHGVESTSDAPPEDASHVGTWAEIVTLRRTDQQIPERVLFWIPDATTMLATAGELLRLGCDRQELAHAGDGFLLRALGAPFYSVARAVDHVKGLRVYAAANERVWVEVGWEHPLAAQIRPPEHGSALLSPHEPWRVVDDGPWTNLYELVDVVLPARPHDHEPRKEDLPRLRIPLRLERGREDAPSLWVVRTDAVEKIERLVSSVPDEVLSSVLFAATGGDSPTILLRLRPSSKRPPQIEVDGEAYRAHMQIPNLFLPNGASIEPPLRRDVIRQILAPDPDLVTWLTGDGDGVRVERVADAAFRPLTDWVEYVIDGAKELDAWVQGARFEFADYVMELEPVMVPAAPDSEPKVRRDKKGRREAEAEPAPQPQAVEIRARRPKAEHVSEEASVTVIETSDVIQTLGEREAEFLAMQTPGDDPSRTVLWRVMGELNARASRAKDATLCYTRAIWSTRGDARELVAGWAAIEAKGRRPADILAVAQPAREDVSALAALLLQAAVAGESGVDTARTAVWLDRHDEALDLRSLWLARAALSRLVGRDQLGLARARDRVLQKLHRGLSLDRDVPTFLRVVTGARDPAQIEKLAQHVQALVKKYEKTKRHASTVEAPPSLTLAYVLFVAACGCARLGRAEVAQAYAERARKLLDLDEPVHGFLARAYLARVEQAVEGLPAETPLPPEIAARLNTLDTFARYKVDRVRQFSQVLEPQERLDPVVAFHRGEKDPRGPEFEPLRGLSDVAALEPAIAKIVAIGKKSAPDERARLYDGVMDFFPFVSADVAIAHLETIASTVGDVPGPRRAQLLEEALMLAGHVGDQELARTLFTALQATVSTLDSEATASMAAVLGGTLRTLRRVGLRAEASALLETMQSAAKGDAVAARVARVHAASALAYVGSFDRAKPALDEALTLLKRDMPMQARLELTRAVARAVSHAPIDFAIQSLERMAERLEVITDSFNTNSHVCVSVVSFMESLIFGYASDDLGVSESGRQWLDDDEYLIRKRIQRETSEK